MNRTDVKWVTHQQIADIRKVLADLRGMGLTACDLADSAAAQMNDLRTQGRFTFVEASTWITCLVNVRINQSQVGPVEGPAPSGRKGVELPDVPAGRYAVEVDGVLKFYKIEVSDSGFITGYVQASDELHKLHFAALKGVLVRIAEVGPVEASKAYGREIGRCGVCNRALTDATSRANGIGPVCAEKLG